VAISFTAIGVILFAPRADQAYTAAIGFAVGPMIAAIAAAIIEFSVLPNLETFAGFSVAIGLWLVPASAAATQPWRRVVFTYMAAYFPALLAPTNQMIYDTQQFYNTASAIIAGSAAAALSFRLIPPLSPAFRTRRLLALALHDLHRLATGPIPQSPKDWESRMYGRFSVLPDAAKPFQRSQLLAALTAGSEIIQLRRIARRLKFEPELDAALEAIVRGYSGLATAHLGGPRRRAGGSSGRCRVAGARQRSRNIRGPHPTSSYFDAGTPG
jgi:uncharacterized membrane protein YccC